MRSIVLSGLFAILLAGLVSCGNDDTTDANVLNIYTARHYDSDQALYDAFEKETGIKVELVAGKGPELLARLRSEGDNSPCDVFVTVDAGNLATADAADVFQPTKSAALSDRIPSHLRHEQGHWFGFSSRVRCIFYDKNKVKPADLSTYEALADPEWKGRVLIRSSKNVYNQSLVGSLIENLGVAKTETWAKGLVANMARPPQGGDTDQIRAVAAGEGDVAVGNSYYYARLMKSEKAADKEVIEKVGIFFPNQGGRGAHVNISGAGVAKHAKNVAGAVKFLEFLASDEAQKMFARGNNEFPVVPGAEGDPLLDPWLATDFDTQTRVEAFGARNREAIELMDRAGWR